MLMHGVMRVWVCTYDSVPPYAHTQHMHAHADEKCEGGYACSSNTCKSCGDLNEVCCAGE